MTASLFLRFVSPKTSFLFTLFHLQNSSKIVSSFGFALTFFNKVLFINSAFTIKDNSSSAKDSIYIEGYASTNDIDRAGDVVPVAVWEKGIKNYLKNPVVLAYHDHNDPVGRVVEHRVDSKGLWVKARISSAAEIYNLVKDNVLTAFSIGFKVLDASYDAATEVFSIKQLELVEISIVSVPCNQDTLFSLSKSFKDDEEYKLFKTQFASNSESAKGLESSKVAKSTTSKELEMDPKELQTMLDTAAANAANQATEKLLAAQRAETAAREKALADEAALQKRIAEAVAAVTPSTTGAEKLMAEIEKRFADQTESTKSVISGLEATLAEKAAEITAIAHGGKSSGGLFGWLKSLFS